MDAILLAGGFGTRLRPLTYTRPKPLLDVAGRPMVEWVLDRLPADVDRVIVALNWKADDLEAHFAASGRDVEFVVVREDQPLGTGGAMRNCLDQVRSDAVLVVFADIVCDFDLGRMVHSLQQTSAACVVALREVPADQVQQFGVADLDEEHPEGIRLRGFVEKPATPEEAPSRFINAGIYLMRRSVLESIPPGRLVSFEKEVLPRLLGDGVFGVPYEGLWMDVGDPDRVLAATAALDPESSLPDDAELAEDAIVTDTVAGSGLRVGAGAGLDHCVLGRDVTVADGVMLRDCIVGDGETVTRSTRGQRIWTRPVPREYPEKQVGNAIA